MKRSFQQMQADSIEDCVRRLVIAVIMGDVCSLVDEITLFLDTFSLSKLGDAEKDALGEVSLQASMDGRVECLEALLTIGMPIDEMCPIIAACHGRKGVIAFCEKNSIGSCEEAWNAYFDWMICNGSSQPNDDEGESLTLATEWVSAYKGRAPALTAA